MFRSKFIGAMKKIFFAAFSLVAVVILSSCDSEKCIRCTQISGGDSKEFCSRSIEERNDFQVEWIHQGYNCEEVQE